MANPSGYFTKKRVGGRLESFGAGAGPRWVSMEYLGRDKPAAKVAETSYLLDYEVPMVLAVLKDPKSAEFRNGVAYGIDAGSSPVICGEVNAKNAFGAYTGFQHYIVNAVGVKFDDGSADFESAWNRQCR